MAIGLALMLGVRLPNNFLRPYTATSIVDFWRRWHITLSFWLRDYLYIPLGGKPPRPHPGSPQHRHHDGAGRLVARRELDLRRLGPLPRPRGTAVHTRSSSPGPPATSARAGRLAVDFGPPGCFRAPPARRRPWGGFRGGGGRARGRTRPASRALALRPPSRPRRYGARVRPGSRGRVLRSGLAHRRGSRPHCSSWRACRPPSADRWGGRSACFPGFASEGSRTHDLVQGALRWRVFSGAPGGGPAPPPWPAAPPASAFMVIKASSAKQIDALVADLASSRAITREAATARLTVFGGRAVDRLMAFARSDAPPAARAAALRTFEAIGDPHGLDTALHFIDDRGSRPRACGRVRGPRIRPQPAGRPGGGPFDDRGPRRRA